MPTKCVKCGVVSEVGGAFQKVKSSLNCEVIEHYCPDCWARREIGKRLETLALYLVALAIACVWVVGEPSEPTGWALLNCLLLPIFLIATILPHELGHSIAARLFGWPSLGRQHWAREENI